MMERNMIVLVCAVFVLGGSFGVNGQTSEMLLSRSTRMVKGTRINIEQAPWQVILLDEWRLSASGVCSGSIISSNWVVTAAHCTCGSSLRKYKLVSSGASDFLDGSVHHIVETICHPLYEVRNEVLKISVHDISVLRVAEPFVFGGNCQPIPLYSRALKTVAKSLATITGWGMSSLQNNTIGSLLKSGTVELTSAQECKAVLSTIYINSTLPTGQVCAKPVSGTPCVGDLDGPLTVDGILVGITSWRNVTTSCTEDYPIVYTEVARYRYWISENTLV